MRVCLCVCVRACTHVRVEATGQPWRNSTNCDRWVLPEGLLWLISLANLLCVIPLALSVGAPRSSSTTSGIHPPKTPTYTPCLLPRAQCRLLSPGLCCWKGPASGLHWQRRLISQPCTHTHTNTQAWAYSHTFAPTQQGTLMDPLKMRTNTHTHTFQPQSKAKTERICASSPPTT